MRDLNYGFVEFEEESIVGYILSQKVCGSAISVSLLDQLFGDQQCQICLHGDTFLFFLRGPNLKLVGVERACCNHCVVLVSVCVNAILWGGGCNGTTYFARWGLWQNTAVLLPSPLKELHVWGVEVPKLPGESGNGTGITLLSWLYPFVCCPRPFTAFSFFFRNTRSQFKV